MKNSLLYIGNKLASKGNTLTVMETLLTHFKEEGYTLVSASSKKNKVLRMLDMVLTFFKYHKQVEIVLIDTYSTSNFFYAYVIARLCQYYKKPYIPILHGGNLPNRLEKSPKKSKRLFGKAFMNVAPSGYLLEAFQKKGFENTIHIPNTIELANYPFTERKTVTLKLLWVRSFSKIYNPMLALHIVESLVEKGISVSLCMVGPEKDGSLAQCKEYVSQKSLPVTFTGLLSKAEWISLSTSFDLFINTTHFDNTPVSLIEAMALGLPIISTNVGGIPWMIDHNKTGILVPPNNKDAFVTALVDLRDDSQKVVRLSRNARDLAAKYDWYQVKDKWQMLLAHI